eukprot:1888102-Rhodomonas_salina.1
MSPRSTDAACLHACQPTLGRSQRRTRHACDVMHSVGGIQGTPRIACAGRHAAHDMRQRSSAL